MSQMETSSSSAPHAGRELISQELFLGCSTSSDRLSKPVLVGDMVNAISFGAVWTAWARGYHYSFVKDEAHHLRKAPQEFYFHFGRNQDELIESVPVQVTWLNDSPDLWVFDPNKIVYFTDLEPKVRDLWQEFCGRLLFPAIADKRIVFGVCGMRSGHANYYDYAQHLVKQGEQVVNYLT